MTRRTMYRLGLAVLIALFAAAGGVQADDFAKVGTTGADFLKLPIGARGVGMGGAFSAISNDASAMFWNPAGLVSVPKTSVMFEHVTYFADISYDAVGGSHRINDTFTVGAFALAMGSGDMEVTTVSEPNGTGENFNVTNIVGGVSVAMNLTDKFAFGTNLKYIREDLDTEIATNYAVDVGVMYDTQWNSIRLAMAVRNFGPEMELDGGYLDFDNGSVAEETTAFLPYHFPMVFKLGVALDPVLTDVHRLTLAGDLEHPNDNIERVNVGAEYGFQELFFLRGGYTFRHDTLGLSAGVGAMWQNFGVDYAFSEYGILEDVHRFNVSFSF
jgi:Type IX secretion system protein PorV